jgi:hypothetical protein
MQISNYSKIYQLGHRVARNIFDGPVVVQEKVDGSQFSFANVGGKLQCRSKNNAVGTGGNPEGMFAKAVATAQAIFDTGMLHEDMVVRTEVLDKPKHNVLAYARVPVGNLILYDVERHQRAGDYLRPEELQAMAKQWGLEVVTLFAVKEFTLESFKEKITEWFATDSILGGTKIEGVVVKNYALRDQDDDVLMAKFVSEGFKERMDPEYVGKPQGTVTEQIVAGFGKEAIWQKAVQHLRDEGKLKGDPKDIGPLIAEIKNDFHAENYAEVSEKIIKAYYAEVVNGIITGFPQWYKTKMMEDL